MNLYPYDAFMVVLVGSASWIDTAIVNQVQVTISIVFMLSHKTLVQLNKLLKYISVELKYLTSLLHLHPLVGL